ncbi:sugar phosphate isomerase/epimerase family protein [Agaribacter flavus]|uniref:Sugar phosphate isomerase/epimerase family protein n=1 Tax=Agaribacter flavus TaxID=1902781 RepID=A0ABV7FQF9_9ALTE
MKLEFYAPIWGFDEMDFDVFIQRVIDSGFDGIEIPFHMGLSLSPEHLSKIKQIKSAGLKYIAQHYETVCLDIPQYKKEIRQRLELLASTEPTFINSQTGRDFFSFEDNLSIIDECEAVAQYTGVKLVHETHRGRFSFASHTTEQFLNARPDLKLNADLSHWCCVAGTLLDDQEDRLHRMFGNMHHIHSRVGFSEGPQIADPTAPEYASTVARFLSWWSSILDKAQARGEQSFPITTEFGPAPYMPLEPHTQRPLCDQWEANIYIKQLIKENYKPVTTN